METDNIIKKHIIIIGGGFAGLNLARKLLNNKFYQVTLIDKNNYNYFTPLLYQVAISFLDLSLLKKIQGKVVILEKNNQGEYRAISTPDNADQISESLIAAIVSNLQSL